MWPNPRAKSNFTLTRSFRIDCKDERYVKRELRALQYYSINKDQLKY